ncbi:MAG TPA: AMP-binding protein [Phenylobacterium sp.]|nr:AMP-binding protein [Phenylobacterium sp.]
MTEPLVNEFSLSSLLDELARSRGGHTAAIGPDVCHNYRTLRARVIRLANALEGSGVGRGDRVLWLGQNSHRILEGVLACARLGAMFCPVNWRQTGPELAYVIDDFQPKVVFWQDLEIGEAVAEARATASFPPALWVQAGEEAEGQAYETFLASGAAEDRDRGVPAGTPVLVIYTAAFFGRPNGAMLSQSALLWQNLSVQQTQGISRDTVFLNSGPMFHVGCLMFTFATFHAGGTNVFVRRTEAEELCRLIHDHRCTLAFLVGKTCADMAEVNKDGRYDLKCLRSPSYLPAFDAMVTVNPRDFRDTPYGYGQTEAMGIISWVYYCDNKGLGTHGAVGPVTQLRIVDAEDRDAPDGEVGEILLRGPTVMSGYWNRPELNAERQRGGWHHTNDLGRREADGTITFIGPKTQMIKSGAENIYPAEVEGCLKRHPAVADAAIIGVPDPRFIQSVKAIVQLKPGARVEADELVDHCRGLMASYKKPRFVEFADSLPRTKVGAVDYRALDAAYGGGNYPGGALRGS